MYLHGTATRVLTSGHPPETITEVLTYGHSPGTLNTSNRVYYWVWLRPDQFINAKNTNRTKVVDDVMWETGETWLDEKKRKHIYSRYTVDKKWLVLQ